MTDSQPSRRPAVPFSQWSTNYQCAYLLSWLGLLGGSAVVVAAWLGAIYDPAGVVLAGAAAGFGAVAVVVMPRWALDGRQEQQRRQRARAARRRR